MSEEKREDKKSIMWKYISQEPEVLKNLMDSKEIESFVQEAGKDLETVCFVAHGSSYNAAVSAADFMARTGGVRVYAYTPANFRYNPIFDT